jgi:hypothetical protein
VEDFVEDSVQEREAVAVEEDAAAEEDAAVAVAEGADAVHAEERREIRNGYRSRSSVDSLRT